MDNLLSDVACVGTENSLLDCPGNISPVNCDSGEDAALVCQGMYMYVYIILCLFYIPTYVILGFAIVSFCFVFIVHSYI